MKLIVDGDPLVYRAGFAAEKRQYQGIIENSETGNVTSVLKDSAKEMKEYEEMLANLPGGVWRLIARDPVVTPEPIANALQNLDMQMQHIGGQIIEKFGRKTPFQTAVLLTGPGNFREKLATIRPYKGNRDPLHKPVHYQAIRDHLTHVYGARVVHGREADDEVSIVAHTARREGIPYVVATIDKDLDQVPGLHYDYRLHVFYSVTPDEARRALWVQILEGDAGDNVPGCYGVGRERAARMVDDSLAIPGVTDLDLWEYVVAAYADSQKKVKCPYKDADPWNVALETAQLVYMQTRPGEVWEPTGPVIKKVDNYED